MEKGQIIKINGRLGFLMNPTMEVVSVGENLITLRPYPNKEGGLLSGLNESTHGIDLIKNISDIV